MARRKQHESHENHERWLVSYADFITLLFAFFVVMYSVSSINEGKYRVLSESIESSFRTQSRSLMPINIGKPSKNSTTKNQPGLIQLEQINQNNPGSPGPKAKTLINLGLDGLPPPRFNDDEPDQTIKSTVNKIAQQKRKQIFKQLSTNLQKAMSPLMKQGLVDVSKHDEWVEVAINSNVLFASGSARLSRQSIPLLEKIAKLLSPIDASVYVEGFTDNVPINNAIFPSNWELSATRAASVVHLFTRAGVSPTRLAATGFGEYYPIASNATKEGRRKNRRVVLIINSDSSPRYIKTKKVLPKARIQTQATQARQTTIKQKPAEKTNEPQIRFGPGLQ